MVNKYNLCDKVRTKIHYKNDNRKEVDAFIRGIELVDGVDGTDKIRYKIWFESDEFDKKLGSTGCIGYISQEDIIGLCSEIK